ncbi:hypothetical protein QFC19_007649 [Naganishia cerealis]|uniref:Uncharacterized protein n=1 Tax=Naganishia cerealis TaxID=610337 RepID=A0ACC2V7P4_9TREE|nr:hypothetical protein QFC19_007649 [Naganishia cerealis]
MAHTRNCGNGGKKEKEHKRLTSANIQILQSLGYTAQQTSLSSTGSIIDLRSTQRDTQEDDTTEFLRALLAESQDAAVNTFGAGSFCVGNVSDDPDIEDFTDPVQVSCNIDDQAGIIKGSKLYNLLAGLGNLQKVTVSSRDDAVLLVAWIGERKGTVVGLLGAAETT